VLVAVLDKAVIEAAATTLCSVLAVATTETPRNVGLA
jgi:hypothetical protein